MSRLQSKSTQKSTHVGVSTPRCAIASPPRSAGAPRFPVGTFTASLTDTAAGAVALERSDNLTSPMHVAALGKSSNRSQSTKRNSIAPAVSAWGRRALAPSVRSSHRDHAVGKASPVRITPSIFRSEIARLQLNSAYSTG